MKGLFITGTDTDVGKTYIACQIAAELTSRNINVIPRKPVESGCQRLGDELIPHDARTLSHAAQFKGGLQQVCAHRFEPPISPQRAAMLNHQPVNIAELAHFCIQNIDINNHFLLIEGAGGFYSPLCEDGLNADLAQALALPVVLVTEDKVGCINQVLLAVEAIESRKLSLAGIILNATTPHELTSHMDNFGDLVKRLNYPIFRHSYATKRLHAELILQLITQ